MNGRLENDIKVENKITEMLNDMPDYIYEWDISMKANNNTAVSRLNYITIIRRYLESINKNTKKISIDDINYLNTEKFFISIQTKKGKNGEIIKTSDSHKQTTWYCLNNFMEFMRNRKYIEENYIKNIKKPKNKDLERINNERILLNEDDFNKIIKNINDTDSKWKNRDLAIMLLFMTTGMRKTALSEINLSDIDLDNRIIKVLDKNEKHHTYILSDKLVDVIDKWLDDRYNICNTRKNIETDSLFISAFGKRMAPKTIYEMVSKYCDEALGYHVSPHKLRAGFCSIMYSQCHDIEKVRRMVGHSSVTTTQRYIVTGNIEKEESMDTMTGLLNF